MKFIDLFKMSTRMFKARTSRTLLTILGMSIGIGAILFLVSLGFGLQDTLLSRITTSDSLLTLDISEAKSGIVFLDNDLVKKIQEMPGVEEVSPSFQVNTQGHLEDLSADLAVTGIKPSFLKLGGLKASSGKLINDEDPDGIVINSAVSQVFGKSPDEMLGKEMTFTFFIPKKKEVGENQNQQQEVLETETERIESKKVFKIVGIIEGEENVVYINAAALNELQMNRFSWLKVKCKTTQQMGEIRDTILEYGLLVSSLSETVDQAKKIFKVVQIVLMLFGIIALVVSAIGMFNTMTIALMERTEEIGIMKSIGASDTHISIMFFLEASIMGFLGGVSGVTIGWLGGKTFNTLINFVASRFGGEKVSLFSSPVWLVVGILISSAVVGFATGIVPARRASKTDPLDALRYK